MFKVLIADDENRILKYMQTCIPWKQLELEVVATASDGLEAIDIIKNQHIDIVITDIRMPHLSGLELCKHIHELDAAIQIIIVSGYADFSYAQKAIQYQVLGYCLKPIDQAELTLLLKTATKNLSKKVYFNYDNLLDSIEDGDEASIKRFFEESGLKSNLYFVAVSINLHNINNILGGKISLKLGKHKYLYFSDHPFNQEAAHSLVCDTQDYGGIGIYPKSVSAVDLKEAISDTIIMAYQYFINHTATLCQQLVEGSLTNNLFHNLSTHLDSKDHLNKFITNLKSANSSILFNIRSAYKLYNQIYFSKILEHGTNAEEPYLYGYEQLAIDYSSFSDVLDDVLELLTETVQGRTGEAVSPATNFMKIIKHLNEHFQKDISLKTVSILFHMNSNYLSQLFKSETGLTYSQYITELRINKAKQLIQQSHLSLGEISEAVGFNDYFYFIKKFKKVVGVTPGHFGE